MTSDNILPAAIIQAAPIPLAVGDGIDALLSEVEAAVDEGAVLIACGETFLGGYPLWLDQAPGAALWDHPGTKALHAILLSQALVAADPRLEGLQALVDRADLRVSFGAHERIRSSLYNSQYLLRPGTAPLIHRKLVPTHGERLIWARGDGSTLGVHSDRRGTIGSLICWEHWMPLARMAMHHAGEDVHVAAWPTVRETYALASRHYAIEGRCFVLAAGTVQHRDDLLDGLRRVGGDVEAERLIRSMPDGQLQSGSSMIVDPAGVVMTQAGESAVRLHATLDLARRRTELTALDVDGHYSRPDIFELVIDRGAKPGVRDAVTDGAAHTE